MKASTVTILGTTICLAALAAWVYLAPAAGSGWILVFTFLVTLGFLNSIRDRNLSVFAGLIILCATALTWYFNRTVPDSYGVLALTILTGFVMFDDLCTLVSSSTRPKSSCKQKR